MGISIDEATLYMELYKRKLFNSVSDLEKDIEAYDVAIDTMRKYQKIAEIVQACGADYNSMDSYDCLEEIARILRHGNDD